MKAINKLLIIIGFLCIPVITNASGTLTISGSIGSNHSEQDIIDGGQTIILTLTGGAKWVNTVKDSLSTWQSVFSSSGNWSMISSSLSSGDLALTNDSVFTVTLPSSSSYAIWANEVVTITIPDGLLATGNSLNTDAFTVTNLAPVISVSGSSTFVSNHTEADVIAGSKTIILNVARDNWAPTLGASGAVSTAFINSITGDQDWTVVKALMTYANIVRTSNTTLTLTLPAAAAYLITSDETLTLAIPGTSYRNGTVKDPTNPTLTVTDLDPQVTLSGTALSSVTEYNIRTGGKTIIFDVKYDTWQGTIDNNNAMVTAFLDGITGNLNWSTVRSALLFSNITKNSTTKITITLPAASGYVISSNESVSINIPSGTFNGSAGANLGAAFTVTNVQAATTATWSTGSSTLTEAQVRSGGYTLTLDLTSSDTWVSNTATLKTQFTSGLNGGAGSEWNTKVLPNISVTRPTTTKAVITFAAASTFDISALQTISFAIPDAALNVSSGATVSATPVSFSISPAAASASITPVSINETALNGATIDVALTEVTFSNPATLGISDFSLTLAPPNTSVTSVTNKTSTGARLTLAYTGDIDVDGSLQVTVNSGLTGGGTLVSNTATVIAFIEPSLLIEGTVIANHSEQNIIDGGQTIVFSLQQGATWIPSVADSISKWRTVFSSSGNWSMISSAINSGNLSRNNDTTFTITLPSSSNYAIWADEVITLSIPNEFLATGVSNNTPTITITNQAPVITINGSSTLLTNHTEANVIAGAQTIILNVSRDNWATTLGGSNAVSTAFINSISGNQDWAVVKGLMTYANIVRTSNTTVTVTLPAAAAYVITADETVTLAIPATSYRNATVKSSADPSLIITDLAPVVTLSGTALPSVLEYDVRTGGKTIVMDVKYDTWQALIASSGSIATALLDGITGDQNWSRVRSVLSFSNLTRNSSTKLTLLLPAALAYAISSNENISINVPAGSFVGSSGANPGAAFSVTNQPANSNATWSVGSSTITEAQVRTGGYTLTLDLTTSDSWLSNTATLKTQFIKGLNGGAGSDWNTKVLPNITVTRPTTTKAVITFPSTASFDISTLQTITFTIPDSTLSSLSGANVSVTPVSFSISPAPKTASFTPVSINEAALNGDSLDITIAEDVFSNPTTLGVSDFSLSIAPPNTIITSVKNKTATSARIILAYTGDIDIDGSLQVTINSGLSGGGTLVSNTAAVVAVLEPVITGVTIPNQTFKIGDNVPVTITVNNDGGQVFTLVSGSVGGRTISSVSRVNSTSYLATFPVISGTTDYPAISDIPVSFQLQVGVRAGNLYTAAISQNSDFIDATPPVVSAYQALGTVNKIGDVVQLVATTEAGCGIDSALTSINGVSLNSPLFNFISQSSGSYYFSYKISAGDTDVPTPAGLTGQIVFKDPAGNSSLAKTVSTVSGSFSIDAHAPGIVSVSAPDSAYITGEIIKLTITADGNSYSLSPETFINGISFSSGRFSLTGAGPVYTLNYPVQSGDAEVSAGNLPINLVIKDLAGNTSTALTVFSNTIAIYTTKPTATISGTNSICAGDSTTLFVSLTGNKKWNIIVTNGVISLPFNTISSSPFSFKTAPGSTSTFWVSSVTDKNGLSNTGTGTANIIVNPSTSVTINPIGSAYNLAGAAVQLSALPSGGTFSGPGVVSSTRKFYPNIAGVDGSPHTILYTYSNSFGCISKDSIKVSVVEATGVINMPKSLFCFNTEPFTAAAVTDSVEIIGKFTLKFKESTIPSGSGIHDNGNNTATITPTLLVAGDYLLSYKYFLKDTLTLENSFTIESVDVPLIQGFPEPATICENGVPFALLGNARKGTFTGTGVTGNNTDGVKFDPSVTGQGKYLITYTDSTVNGCKNHSSREITVFYVPKMSFTKSDSCVLSTQAGTDIVFTNTTDDKDSISSWEWSFDDINSGALNRDTRESPSHIFKTSGKYSIILTESTRMGCSQTHENNYVFGDMPTGTFSAPKSCFTLGIATELLSETKSNDGISKYFWKIHLPEGNIVYDSTTVNAYNYQFVTPGKYFVEHQVRSNTNCVLNLSDSILLKPTIVLQSGVPYTEDFNTDRGSWSISGENSSNYSGLSWDWGQTNFLNLASPEKNMNAWYTHRANSGTAELSYLISPCYNLSDLERPMIKMDIFRNFVSILDATIIQSSIDNGDHWITLGNPGDGINWYNDYQTSDYAFNSNYGWANPTGISPDTGWVEARHTLDPIADLSGVQFRLAFGAEVTNISNYEGFAIRDITIAERNRFSVMEHFTNTTPVNPIANRAKSADSKLNKLYNTQLLYKDFVKLEYHTRFPSQNDPINKFNQDIPGSRAFYYGVTSVPYCLLDGGDRTGRRFDFTDTKYEPKEVDINLRSLVDPQVAMTVTAGPTGNNLDIGVHISALENLPEAERVLYVAVYETQLSGFTAENGENFFQNVVRDMLPDAGGTSIYQAFTAFPGSPTELDYNFTADISKLNGDSVRVAAYLQNDFTGEIIQAALSDYSKSYGVNVKPGTEFSTGISVYPNPATDFVELKVRGSIGKTSQIEFYDQLGRKISTEEMLPSESSKVISTTGFNKGIYFLRLSIGGVPQSEMIKLVIMR